MDGVETTILQEEWIPVTYKIRHYKAIIELNKLNGLDIKEKMAFLESRVANTDDFLQTRIREIGKIRRQLS